MSFADLPGYLKCAYIFAWVLILVHVLLVSVVAYWQIFEPTNLAYKAWLKGPMHLGLFDSMGFAVGLFIVLLIAQLVALFLYTSWMSIPGKNIYYLVFGLVVLGIWTYMLVPALILLGLMMPAASLQHFGLNSFEDFP